jgi:hypothetical protein
MPERGYVLVCAAVLLCAAAPAPDPDQRAAQAHRDGVDFSERLRESQDSSRRVCAVDRLAESRLPRTTCRTVREWRDRALRDFRKE